MVRGAAHPVRPCPKTISKKLCLSFLIIVVVILQLQVASNAQGIEDASISALIKFKSSLENVEPFLANWDPSISHPCSGNRGNWKGVLCFNGYVWGLQLENMNLRGKIDVDSLVPLRYLRTLSFMNNSFDGQMPDWRKLGALKSLFLSDNQFSGQIPEDAFKGMSYLKKVYMANNKFTGHIPASIESPKLRELSLQDNQFTGNIPPISSKHLKLFNVSNNQLEGSIPAPLMKFGPSSFSGNKALCGKPLDSKCEPPPAPPPDLEPSLGSPPPSGQITSTPIAAKDNKPSPARIAIIVVSALVGLFLIILLLLLCQRNRESQTPRLGVEKSVPVTTVEPVGDMKENGNLPKRAEPQAGKLSFVRDDREKFDLQDLMRASAEVLGSGNFGASYKAVLVEGEALVVKRFKQMNTVAKEDFHEHMRRLGRLKHPNLLPLVAYLYRKEEKLLVFDYVYNGSLASHLHGKRSHEPCLSWPIRLNIIKGVAQGLAYLHRELPSLTVPHAHLKSSNVLLDKFFNPVLMDYSLVPVVNPGQVQDILVAYKSPEYAQHGTTSKKTDVWCLGILILEILTGKLVAKYLSQGSEPYGANLAGWIDGIVSNSSNTEVFDKEIKDHGCIPQMEKLLKIGIACCEEDEDKRWDLEEALGQIQQLQEH
ncbi:pollen receptor-like kinase 4 [Primulina tabacum]|uniref:pollen receptor-like kinase 4 n=1 Tax=Primulina tabacum TaxID=48773 RepID=UPI003F59DE64